MSQLRIAVTGATGRMGTTLMRHIIAHPDCILTGATEAPGHAALGQDVGVFLGLGTLGIPLSADADAVLAQAGALVDFTTPAATIAHVKLTAARGLIHVIGTTGLNSAQESAIKTASNQACIVKSGNMSLGVNVLAELTRQAARILNADFDIEILDLHHRNKVDAPSGTALLLGRAAAEGRSVTLDDVWVRSRDGHTGERPRGSIGFAALRGGSIVGEHSVILAGEAERIELSHKAEDRSIFAKGALTAALWARGKPAGLYSMSDVLGFS